MNSALHIWLIASRATALSTCGLRLTSPSFLKGLLMDSLPASSMPRMSVLHAYFVNTSCTVYNPQHVRWTHIGSKVLLIMLKRGMLAHTECCTDEVAVAGSSRYTAQDGYHIQGRHSSGLTQHIIALAHITGQHETIQHMQQSREHLA